MRSKLADRLDDMNRLGEIIDVLMQEGFGYLIGKIRLKSLIKGKKRSIKKEKLPPEVRLRLTLERLGPTFIKFGQILSLRPDLIPKKYVQELGKLQDAVPPFPYKEVKSIIEQELHKPIGKLFKSFDEKPIASASIAQVHKAKLKSGETVAVKIQRPNVKKIMDTDIEIMFYIAELLEKYFPKIRKYKPHTIVKEFNEWTDKELDFRIEAKNAKIFYKNFKDSDMVIIPKIFDNYSGRRVLTAEFIDGIPLHDIKKIKGRKGYKVKEIIQNGFEAVLTQIFIHGFFHADPHPGNILVLKGNKIGFVDFGIVGELSDYLKEKCADLAYSIIEGDADSIIDVFLEMKIIDKENTNPDELKEEIDKVMKSLKGGSTKYIKISHLIEETLDIALEHSVKMPVNIVLFGKTLIEMEGIALEYAPNFKFAGNAKPFLETLIKRRFNLIAMSTDLIKNLIKFRKFIRDFPREATKALRTIQKGRVKIDVDDSGIKKLSLEIDRSSNRIAYGMVIAALIVAGALTINVDMPRVFNIPWVSFLAYIFAMVMGAILLSSILSEGELKEVKK